MAPGKPSKCTFFRKPCAVPEKGDRDWDLVPNSKMTNANIGAVVGGKSGRVLTLDYKGGTVKVTVPANAPGAGFEPADRSIIVPGTYVFVIALKAAEGTLSPLPPGQCGQKWPNAPNVAPPSALSSRSPDRGYQ